ncbi:hypothetical protein GUJ93_ZPchr0002g26147 [Zizania palustris]|uniref:Uncharacterized protein n=1 Tax=Zizania palustris TaxID=103762 RepID=A0A8J5VEM1_ZIZPA|nr:hypothetical protein GUJ93_ZPchr0002g26147 [Zizania palustris]
MLARAHGAQTHADPTADRPVVSVIQLAIAIAWRPWPGRGDSGRRVHARGSASSSPRLPLLLPCETQTLVECRAAEQLDGTHGRKLMSKILKIDDEFDNGLKKKITQSSNLSKTVDGVTKAFEIHKKKEALYQQIMADIPEELQGIDDIVDNLQDAYNAGLHIGTDDEEDKWD